MSEQSVILDKNGANFEIATKEELDRASNEAMVDFDSVSIGQMLSADQQSIRNRIEIYRAYQYMANDPIISTALNLHVTQSLGAHESTNEVFFIESKADATKNEQKIIDDLRESVAPLLNKMAYEIAYSGATFGDAYARIYSKPKVGVQEIYFGDKLHSAIVQPMMRGEKTAGYMVSLEKESKRNVMSVMQLARFKMPRTGMVAQQRILLNAWNDSLLEDDLDRHMPLPDTIGGSFLQDAERPFYMLQNALFGLNSSRIMDAVQESMITLNMEGMNNGQQKRFMNSMVKMLSASKHKLEKAIATGQPITERLRHILPVSSEKQLTTIDNSFSGSGNANSFNTEDVMLYARMLAAALGHDLSMLGFSDQLSGGLGDGGFFRISAQSAQRAIWIRQGFTDFVNHVIDVHLQQKYGGTFQRRPYEINFIGAQTALEKEKQDIQDRRSMSAATVLQTMQQMLDLGLDEKGMVNFMKNQLAMDEDDALLYAKQLAKKQTDKPAEDAGQSDFNE